MEKTYPTGFKVELVDGEVVSRSLTEEEKKKEEIYAQEVLNSFVPRKS